MFPQIARYSLKGGEVQKLCHVGTSLPNLNEISIVLATVLEFTIRLPLYKWVFPTIFSANKRNPECLHAKKHSVFCNENSPQCCWEFYSSWSTLNEIPHIRFCRGDSALQNLLCRKLAKYSHFELWRSTFMEAPQCKVNYKENFVFKKGLDISHFVELFWLIILVYKLS